MSDLSHDSRGWVKVVAATSYYARCAEEYPNWIGPAQSEWTKADTDWETHMQTEHPEAWRQELRARRDPKYAGKLMAGWVS